jgi:hypothetical protein
MMVDDVVSTFIELAGSTKELHGKWIPTVYWASLVSQELDEDEETSLTAAKLKKFLEKRAVLDRKLDQSAENIGRFKCIHKVLHTVLFVPQRPTSMPMTKQKSKKRDFLCVCMAPAQSVEALEMPMNCKLGTVTMFYKNQYTRCANMVGDLRRRAPALSVNTSRAVLPTIDDEENMQPRLVTPPNAVGDDTDHEMPPSTSDINAVCTVSIAECRSILGELFAGIINASVLEHWLF